MLEAGSDTARGAPDFLLQAVSGRLVLKSAERESVWALGEWEEGKPGIAPGQEQRWVQL